jgi:hypothetical protein
MTRIDLHRPSVINPEDYDFVALKYDGSSAEGVILTSGALAIIRDHMDQTGGKYSGHTHGGSCHVCGANALYLAVYHHRPSNTYICTGEDCADKMDLGRDEFHATRKAVAAGEAAATGKKRAERTLTERGLASVWALYTAEDQSAYNYAQDTLCNLTNSLVRYGDLTPKQWSYLEKLVEKLPELDARAAEKAAKLATQKAISQHVGTVGERTTFTATVVVRASYDSQFGPQSVFVCEDDAGNVLVYKGSAVLWNAKDEGAVKGDRVTFKSTIKAHGEREGVKQTILTRPAKTGA